MVLATSSIEIVPETNTITVTNTYDVTVPTGITIRYEMIGIVALVLVAIAGSIVISKKFRKARD